MPAIKRRLRRSLKSIRKLHSVDTLNTDDRTSDEKSSDKVQKGRLKRGRIRIVILSSLLLILLLICFTPGGPEFTRNLLYSLLDTSPTELKLPANSYESGRLHGEKRSFAITLLCDIYLKRIVCMNSSVILNKQKEKAEKLFSVIDKRWTDEARGIADGSGVDRGVIMLANSFLDIGGNAMGCREVVLVSGNENGEDKRLLHAHNLDWNNLGGVGNFLVTIFRTDGGDGRYDTVRIGFPGLIGALTIINEKGISLGFNQLGHAQGESRMPVFIEMRNIAETCANFADAEKMVMDMPEGMPFCIVLSDAKLCRAAVFERLADGIVRKREIEDNIITADNCAWCGYNTSDAPVRREVLRIRKSGKSGVDLVKAVLRDSHVLLDCNIYSVIFDYKNNTFYLASGKIPAAKGEYRKFILFKN